MDNVRLNIGLLESSSSMVTLIFFFSLDVNRNGPKTNSTTNHIFNGAGDDFMVLDVNNHPSQYFKVKNC
jgi:hypothetical protein